jgi:DNA-binding response OmpR family regulator
MLSLFDGNNYNPDSKKRILVVDDEYDISFTLQAGLEDAGFDVDAFTDPELAV